MIATARADQPLPDWFAAAASTLQKAQDLPSNVLPDALNIDCEPITYHTSGSTSSTPDCVGATTIGTISAKGNGLFVNGSAPLPLKYNGGNSMGFLPRPGSTDVMAIYTATGSRWNYLGFYNNLTHADFTSHSVAISPAYIEHQLWTNITPTYLQDGVGRFLQLNTQSMAFSTNGQWLVADSSLGMIRIDLTSTTPAITVFGPMLEQQGFGGLVGTQLAITNDGRYAAVSIITGNGFSYPSNLALYDIAGCTGGVNYAGCRSKDIWGAAGTASTSGLGRPTNLRFVDANELSFNDTYNATAQTFQAGVFVLAPSGASLYGMGLLGLGDSYISGEGEFTYTKDTDSSSNHCHQSLLSYPFLLGAAHFGAYDSVACSGAIMTDLYNTSPNYLGQVHHSGNGSELQVFEPGYLPQDQFVASYKPQAVLLSIGGNDIGFGSIVAQCVAGFVPNQFDSLTTTTCYPSYEDRYELAQSISTKFNDLVQTYRDVKVQAPGTRVYVAGYPHIAEPGGACGLNVNLNTYEVQFSTDLIDYLDTVIAQAAAKAGVFYVDTRHALDGHKLCESGDKAVNGLTAGDDQLGLLGHESYHPTVLGHQLLASAIDAATDGLQAPMPAPLPDVHVPAITDSLPLLANAPEGKSGRQLYTVTSTDAATGTLWQRGQHVLLNLGGLISNFAAGTTVQAVIHSDPENLGTITANGNGDIASDNLTVPDDLPSGYHVLHLYGTDLAGNKVDVQQTVYVAASADDTDGDGITNDQDSCPMIANSGADVDQDGLDDTCDAVIGDLPVAPPNDPATDNTTPPSSDQTDHTDPPVGGAPDSQPSQSSNVAIQEAASVQYATTTPQQPTNQPEAALRQLVDQANTLGDSTSNDILDVSVLPVRTPKRNSYARYVLATGMVAGVGFGVFAILFYRRVRSW